MHSVVDYCLWVFFKGPSVRAGMEMVMFGASFLWLYRGSIYERLGQWLFFRVGVNI